MSSNQRYSSRFLSWSFPHIGKIELSQDRDGTTSYIFLWMLKILVSTIVYESIELWSITVDNVFFKFQLYIVHLLLFSSVFLGFCYVFQRSRQGQMISVSKCDPGFSHVKRGLPRLPWHTLLQTFLELRNVAAKLVIHHLSYNK